MLTPFRRRALAILKVVVVFGAAAAARADTYPRQPGIQVQHYAFQVTLLTTDATSIDATAIVRLRIGNRHHGGDAGSGHADA